jgi:hypothetical protein
LKEKEDNETNLVRRKRCQYRRVRNYYFGCSWLRRPIANNSQKPRGQANAVGPRQVGPDRERLVLEDRGSVTAEFAVVLPGVLLVLYFALAVLALQSSRIALVELAAEGSRALARGESEQLVSELITQSGLGPKITFESSFTDLSICVEVVQNHEIGAFGATFPIELSEVQCARKGGL